MARTSKTKTQMKNFIDQNDSSVFLRSDFDNIISASASHITRCLSALCSEGRLYRLGYGVYVKAMKSLLSGNQLVYEVLERLGATLELREAAKKYNSGASTQIPVGFNLTARGGKRITRRLGIKGKKEIDYNQ
ncbi:MAG TPA: hypothetical protein VJY63_09910 [Marinospirillum sp.]|uniref:hypothetical protein n=1 Tax=Marinospirillum sp. TaxID=2183934 RepID=UPI002B49C0F0|nr:hypothetical protein [Marinospirillum sp.]HKM16212.1 hypothetical protein [Marinospirillum sp.]